MDKLSECKKILQDTQNKIISSVEEWKTFLRFYAKIYKYNYTSALLIYALRPDAEALAPLSLWNRIGRRINAGAKGIPVIVDDGGYQTLQYLFDVSDTNGEAKTIPVPWKLNQENQNIVLTDLEDRYGITSFSPCFEPRMSAVIESVLNPEYNKYIDYFHETVQGSDLAFLPEEELNAVLYDLLSDSVTYMVYCRTCPDSPVLNSLRFDGLTLMTRPEHANVLGNTTAHRAGTLLRQMETSVRQHDHEKEKEQRRLNHDNRVQGNRRPALSGAFDRGDTGRTAADQIRQGIPEVSEGNRSDPVRDAYDKPRVDAEMPSGGTGSERVRGQSADPAPQRTPGSADGGSHAADSVQQLAVQDGGGNDTEQHRVQDLNNADPDETAAPLESGAAVFASESVESLNDKPAYGGFVSDEDFVNLYLVPVLRHTGFAGGEKRIYDFMQDTPPAKEAAAFVRHEFGVGGGTADFANGLSGFYRTDAKGIAVDVKLPAGDYCRTASWSMAAQTIKRLVDDGKYLPDMPVPQKLQLSLFDMISSGQREKSGTSSAFEPIEKPEEEEKSRVDRMLDQAKKIAAASAVEPYERFSVIETDGGYAVWDDLREETYIDKDGVSEEFTGEWEAASYLERVKEAVQNRETEEWNYVEHAKFEANSEKSETSSAFDQPAAPKINFHYDSLEEFTGGQKTHYRANLEALQLLKTLDTEHRSAEPEEQKALSRYLGWGGIPQAFDAGNPSWQKEYAELKELLSPESYEAARASTLTAFYTPPAIISAVHTILKNAGFTGGNILEPSCATGRFFGFFSPEVEKFCNLYGVELDSVSGTIAQQLYPNASIQIKGFEKAAFPDNFFDVAFGNVPFGEYKLNDSRYNKQNLLIHDYFFAKTLDKVRPGGMILFVTSKGTMDKANNQFRKYIAQRAELVGAIRFPNTMMQTEANTKVTADLVILKKRGHMVDIEPDWVNLSYLDNSVPVNTYFAEHPDMMLGIMAFDNSMYGSKKDTALLPHEGSDWRDELQEAIEKISFIYEEQEVKLEEKEVGVSIPADPNVKNFSYTIREDKVYYRENAQMVLQDVSGMREQRIRGMIAIRDAMREVIRIQSEDFPEEAITRTQMDLNRFYDDYVHKYGYLTGTANKQAFSLDTDYPLLTSLENVGDSGTVTKAAIFTKRTIRPPMVVTHCETAVESLTVCLDRKGEVDLDYIAELTGKPADAMLEQLIGSSLYRNPATGKLETTDEYLSGNVRAKLDEAVSAAENDGQYLRNAEALKKVQPEDIPASKIDLRLGSPLLLEDDIRQFIFDLLKPASYTENHLKIHFVPSQALWKINGVYHTSMQNDLLSGRTYGTHRMDAYELIELSLNQKTPTIRDKKPDDTYVVNQKETAAAREKQRVIGRKFTEWVFKDPQHRERLVQKYNQIYNNIRLRKYDGSYLTFPGMTPEIALMPHQKNAVARILQSGNTLLAHCVGAGKTYTMIASAMESKRLGMCSKSMFVVPGHLIDQWGADILKLYPGANVLLATKKDFEKKNRQKLVSKIATGDYDAIVIAQSSFEKIPISPERIERLLHKQINDIVESIETAKAERDENWSIKNMERTKKTLEDQLQRLLDQSSKDNLLTFEQLGVDQLFIDEAHYYKNLFVPTKMSNVAGIGQQKARKASDLQMKCQYINELHGGSRGVVFATGTPISNSMSEMFTMQTYLEPVELAQCTLAHFDAWAAQFGRVTSSLELTPDGTQYRYKSRFAEFVNLPELMTVYSLVADIQTADMLQLPVPKLKTGKTVTIVAQPSEAQKAFVQGIVERFKIIHSGGVQPWEDNALKATTDGRNAALDLRIVDPSAEDYSESKVNMAVENIFEIWQRTADQKLTQMVFCDLSTPKYIQMKIFDGVATMNLNQFSSVYEDMKQKLIEKGIPENEVAFIHDANTETQKEKLFSDFRAGKVRILFGSTARMGAGTNAQNKLVALHHMDAPWRPADLEQRDGRILRRGNENPEVEIYRYVTEGTFDAYSWQILEQKQRFISQVSRGEVIERHATDIDDTALDYATVKMLASKDPRIKEREELRVRVAELNQLKAQDNTERYSLEDNVLKILPQRIARNTEAIENITKDIALRNSNHSEEFRMVVGNQTYIKREQAGTAILKKANAFRKSGEYLLIGEYMGFYIELTYSSFAMTHSVVLRGAARHRTDLGQSEIGTVARIDNLLKDFEATIEKCRQDIDYAKQQMDEANAQLATPWEHRKELEEKAERLNQLDIALSDEMGSDEQVLDPEITQNIENSDSLSLEEKLQKAKDISGRTDHDARCSVEQERD